MARPKKEETEINQEVVSPEQLAMTFLKANKEDHYNFEEDNFYKIPASSLRLSALMSGGLNPGAHRHTGWTETGKTSQALDFLFHFLSEPKGRRGVYVKSEGRLSPNMKERSGVKFVTDAAEWKDGTCFVLESNVFEAVFGFLGTLIRNNQTNTKYFFIVDSMDMMAKRDDLNKGLDEAGQVAGGALITSVFLKKTSAALAKRGHIAIFISQVRDSIQINPYAPNSPRLGKASGGHALEHAPDWVLDYSKPNSDEIIREDPKDKNSKPIGHYCKIKVIKSPNETTGQFITYPVKYGRSGGKSVWVEREIADLLIEWQHLDVKGAWISVTEEFAKELKQANLEFPEKIQGMDNLYSTLEERPAVVSYLFNKFTKQIFN